MNRIRLEEVDSTNRYLRSIAATCESMTVVTAEYQSSGRGQGTNTWESAPHENLLMSILTRPEGVEASRQFILSEAIALAVRVGVAKAIRRHAEQEDLSPLTVKWPNDIYWHDHKMGGILIECALKGRMICDCIMGVGLDVNQKSFVNTDRNPISLATIAGENIDREVVLSDILAALEHYLRLIGEGKGEEIRSEYLANLYRREGYHPYSDANGRFMGRIVDVEDSGHLILEDTKGVVRHYAFKEVNTEKQ